MIASHRIGSKAVDWELSDLVPRLEGTRFYRPELDAMRFMAFLMVFLHHILPLSEDKYERFSHKPIIRSFLFDFAASLGGGLSLFFILSAFLLGTLLLREKRLTKTIAIREFYWRRILRIWPLYFAALLVSFVFTALIRGWPGAASLLPYALMVGNFAGLFHFASTAVPGVGHLWSISVEEQFYLGFPACTKLLSKRELAFATVGLAIVSLISIAVSCRAGFAKDVIWRGTLPQMMMFSCGIGMAIYYDGKLPQWGLPLRLFLAGSGFLLVFFSESFGHIENTAYPATAFRMTSGYFLLAIGCSMILSAALGWARSPPKPLIYFGTISYGLYVFHAWALQLTTHLFAIAHGTPIGTSEPLSLLLQKDVAALVATFFAAIISYKFLERPFLSLKKMHSRIASKPI